MATNARLPKIHTLDVEDKQSTNNSARDSSISKQTSKTTSFLSRLQLGSLEQIPLPGDVYYPPSARSKQPRPLGLIPNRNDRLAALKKLSQLFSPLSAGYHSPEQHVLSYRPPEQQVLRRTPPPMNAAESTERPVGTISATPSAVTDEVSHPSVDPNSEPNTVACRLPHQDWDASTGGHGDPDYMTLGEKASEYYAFIGPTQGSGAPVGGAKHPSTRPVMGQDKKKATSLR